MSALSLSSSPTSPSLPSSGWDSRPEPIPSGPHLWRIQTAAHGKCSMHYPQFLCYPSFPDGRMARVERWVSAIPPQILRNYNSMRSYILYKMAVFITIVVQLAIITPIEFQYFGNRKFAIIKYNSNSNNPVIWRIPILGDSPNSDCGAGIITKLKMPFINSAAMKNKTLSITIFA